MQMPGRDTIFKSSYRYGFNDQEKSSEINSDGNIYTAELWEYDARISRRWDIDPENKAHLSPYATFANNPIWFQDLNGADTSKPGLLQFLDDVLLGGQMKNEQKSQLLQAGIKNEAEAVIKDRNLKQQTFDELIGTKPGTEESKTYSDLYEQYQTDEQKHTQALTWLIGQLYKTQRHDDNIQKYNEFINNQLNLTLFADNAELTVASFIPTAGSSSGLFLSTTEIRAQLFNARGGWGLFGKSGLRIGGYKIEAMYANPSAYGTGTIFSIKQIGVRGGNFLRWDLGILHGTEEVGLHSQFRLSMFGKTFGSTNQMPWTAPFKFWKYAK